MPEKPEVLTVVKSLKPLLIGRTITKCNVYWDNIIASPNVLDFKQDIINQKIESITTRGKWIIINLTTKSLLIHLRMEGKFFFRELSEKRNKHEHIVFTLDNKVELRFHDVRKFGKMYLIDKDKVYDTMPLSALGYEYDDKNLTKEYLLSRFSKKRLPIKTVLLDQSIITGIGNIYDDEVLFLSHLNPHIKASLLREEDCQNIIDNTKKTLDKAIKLGGTTIKSFTSSEGVHGLFQNELLVHGKKDSNCPNCNTKIVKTVINGRGTYYCPNCQPER